jgi:hypothetical protein
MPEHPAPRSEAVHLPFMMFFTGPAGDKRNPARQEIAPANARANSTISFSRDAGGGAS